jgi:hypothetical protein
MRYALDYPGRFLLSPLLREACIPEPSPFPQDDLCFIVIALEEAAPDFPGSAQHKRNPATPFKQD